MARKLPWMTSRENTENITPSRAITPIKRDRRLQGIPVTSAAAENGSSRGGDRLGRKPRVRTPSTSPPPGPPDITWMNEGFEADDAYMMVEDEFQAIAQSFTAHLHHAEYKRLMRKAKHARPVGVPELTSQMSQQTRHRLQRATILDRQRSGLKHMARSSLMEEEEDDDGNEDVEEKQIKDPWAGTSLAGLMSTGSQPKVSLKGLENVSGSTKAAHGYLPSSQNKDQKQVGQMNDPRLARAGRADTQPPVSIGTVRNGALESAKSGKTSMQSAIGGKRSAPSTGRSTSRFVFDDGFESADDHFSRKKPKCTPSVSLGREFKREETNDLEVKRFRLDEVPDFL